MTQDPSKFFEKLQASCCCYTVAVSDGNFQVCKLMHLMFDHHPTQKEILQSVYDNIVADHVAPQDRNPETLERLVDANKIIVTGIFEGIHFPVMPSGSLNAVAQTLGL